MKPSVDDLIHQAQYAEREGRRDDARALYERALYSLRRVEDGTVASSLLRWISRTYPQLDANFQGGLRLHRGVAGDRGAGGRCTGAIGHATNVLAIVFQQRGELDKAERLFLEARSHAMRGGEARLAALAAQNLGVIAAIRGDHDKTLHHYRTSLNEFRILGDATQVLSALNNMGMLCWTSSDGTTRRARSRKPCRSPTHWATGRRASFSRSIARRWKSRAATTPRHAGCASWHCRSRRKRRSRSRSARSRSSSAWSSARWAICRRPRNTCSARRRSRVERQDLLLSAETAREHTPSSVAGRVVIATRSCSSIAATGSSPSSAPSATLPTSTGATRGRAALSRSGSPLERIDRIQGSVHARPLRKRVADLACALAVRASLQPRELILVPHRRDAARRR